MPHAGLPLASFGDLADRDPFVWYSTVCHPTPDRVVPCFLASITPTACRLTNKSDRYRHLLREVSTVGAFDEWITYFCGALSAQAKDAESRIRALLTWREEALASLRARGMKGVALAVTEKLIEFPSLTVKHVAATHNVSVQAANHAVARLTEAGVLEEVTGRSYNRVFQAPEVLNILFRPAPAPGR